ncbi:MAG TPA: hypothetical protein DIT25_04055 [Candidatus Moranbacteria bacterium]|nr:hypothetical protein [Candidatus Moranbacteria bacterium]
MARSTVHYADNKTNSILKALHNKLRPAGTPVQRVEYIIELLLLRIFEVKVKRDSEFKPLRGLFGNDDNSLVFSDLLALTGDQASVALNKKVFPFYGSILGKARGVYKNKNLPQKVQDQLVLIEEVFSNSSFSNNVKNGNLNEVLGLVSDIDEERLLKTDLLGDAIESALSEQGGTKDVGLYRTPDHIRQMMVVMADPNFIDTILDPACGTGGFLFDAFQYVMEKVGKDNKWPGDKSHKEIKQYLEKYLKHIETEMPSNNVANTFYRIGISGVEYLGMIRKMAAINLYIRGLNPANIEQGDSLELYNPNAEANGKSIVIANPPFGAKLDQPAYPNVWEEYPKTDSTTLFVKLMFNHLKNGGRCAVVVSEGFLTWDSEAAKEMRKLLLEEANLKAIISLPQGLFVSKGGQGAITSILYFEKGEPTKNVWFYKITNDGYSMGVNRKEIAGCQIPEALELFTKYAKHGKIPPKTKNSFIVPADWIKQIDPRLKERIAAETTEQQKIKFNGKREKEVEKLDGQLKNGKITEKEYKEKFWQFDNVVENNIQNEITKRIEKAHSYSFNLQNYKSILSGDQIKKWQAAFKGIKIKNGANIDVRFQELLSADSKTALHILASFNPESALEIDIVREYLSKIEKKDKKMLELEEILKEAQKYPKVPLGELLINLSEERKFIIDDEKVYLEPTIKTKTNEISVSNESKGEGLKVKKRILLKKGDLVVGLLHTQNGSFAICDQEYVSTGTFVPFEINTSEVNPKYLFHNLRTAFENLGVEDATGRENYKVDDILGLQIPLPPLEIQQEIVEKIERYKEVIDGACKILKNSEVDVFKNKTDVEKSNIGQIAGVTKLAGFEYTKHIKMQDQGEIIAVRAQNVKNSGLAFKNLKYISKNISDGLIRSKLFKNEIVMTFIGAGIGECSIIDENNKYHLAPNVAKITIKDETKIDPYYFWYHIKSDFVQNQIREITRTAAQPSLSMGIIRNINVMIPSIEMQKQIVLQVEKEMEVLEKVRELKKQAEERVNKILEEVWGE